jgi:hypothetical protein
MGADGTNQFDFPSPILAPPNPALFISAKAMQFTAFEISENGFGVLLFD